MNMIMNRAPKKEGDHTLPLPFPNVGVGFLRWTREGSPLPPLTPLGFNIWGPTAADSLEDYRKRKGET